MNSSHPRDVPVLVAVTEQARAALGGLREIRITPFPFKVGREQRVNAMQRIQDAIERRIGGLPPVNDLFLLEPISDSLQISRLHFKITHGDGRYLLEDRQSTCGTIVNGQRLGGDGNPAAALLTHSALIVVGSQNSPYVFRFELRPAGAHPSTSSG